MDREPLTSSNPVARGSAPAVVADAAEAAGLEVAPLLVLKPLEAFLDAHGMGSGPIEATAIGDGHSNVTYLIGRGEERWVLRRPPRGPLPPSAHDVLREFRFLTACAPTPVRVPDPLLACPDPSVIGAPFYLMAYVEGAVITNDLPPGLDPLGDPDRIIDELVAGLAAIHAVDWEATDLRDATPPPGSYLERQVRRFTELWQHNRTREIPEIDRIAAWLAAERPESGPATIVHGDYRLGNTVFSSESPARLLAVLDWEMATVGDPLADLGYLTATYAQAGEPHGPVAGLGSVTAGPGFPDRAEVARRYEALTGRAVAALPWYQVLALWKSAVFLEGSYGRWLKGSTDDAFFGELATGVPELAAGAWDIARAAGAR